jgi:V/A-type H+-transporting ATPase subunit K
MMYIETAVLVLILVASAVSMYFAHKKGKKVKGRLIANICCFFAFCVVSTLIGMHGAAQAAGETASAAAAGSSSGIGLIAAALSTGMSCIGAGIAVAAAASAALGAISENEKAFGKALIFVTLAEGVALYGLLISFQILSKI